MNLYIIEFRLSAPNWELFLGYGFYCVSLHKDGDNGGGNVHREQLHGAFWLTLCPENRAERENSLVEVLNRSICRDCRQVFKGALEQ